MVTKRPAESTSWWYQVKGYVPSLGLAGCCKGCIGSRLAAYTFNRSEAFPQHFLLHSVPSPPFFFLPLFFLSLFFLPCFCSLHSVVRVSIRYRLRPTFGNRSSMSGERTSLSWLKLRSTLDIILVSFSSSSFSHVFSFSLFASLSLPVSSPSFLFSSKHITLYHHPNQEPRTSHAPPSQTAMLYISPSTYFTIKKQSLPSFPSLPTFSPPLLFLFLSSFRFLSPFFFFSFTFSSFVALYFCIQFIPFSFSLIQFISFFHLLIPQREQHHQVYTLSDVIDTFL